MEQHDAQPPANTAAHGASRPGGAASPPAAVLGIGRGPPGDPARDRPGGAA